MNNKFKISQEDIELFQTAVKGTRPLKQSQVVITPNPPLQSKPKLLAKIESTASSLYDFVALNDYNALAEVTSTDSLFFARSGLQNKYLRKLRQGKIPWAATLDLHGYTLKQAHAALQHFIDVSITKKIRTVLIVHGKGYRSQKKPVLKNFTNQWLRQDSNILAFSSAQPKDGGNGAVYVILKTNKEIES